MSKARDQYLMAQVKFGAIAPLVQKTFQDASVAAYCRRVSSVPLMLPDGTERSYEPGTLRMWAALYEKGGLDALIRPPRKDRGLTRALGADASMRIQSLKAQFPKLPATQVRMKLLEEGAITSKVSPRCIQRFVKEWEMKHGQPGGMKDRKAFEEEYFGALWQADSSYFPHMPDGAGKKRRTFLIMVLDDHSRLVVGARLFFTDSAVNFQSVLKDAVATYGICHKIYCDHGSPYICNQTAFICADVGMSLLHAPVRDGSAKGKIERMFLNIKEGWLYGLDLSTINNIDEMNRQLAVYIRAYNLKIHSSTGAAPMDRFLATRGRIKQPLSRGWLDDKFMHRVNRKVAGDSTIRIDGIQWDAPMQYIGQTVEVRYLPGDGADAYISAGGERIHLRRTNKTENARTRRAGPSIDYSKAGGANGV